MQPIDNIQDLARPCALFSYIVHIIRDFEEDQKNNLNYFALDILDKYGLDAIDLQNTAYGKQNVSDELRQVMKEYLGLAAEYKKQTIDVLNFLKTRINERYFLSLRIIFDLYLQVFERIDIENGSFTTEELNPSPDETRARVLKCIEASPHEIV